MALNIFSQHISTALSDANPDSTWATVFSQTASRFAIHHFGCQPNTEANIYKGYFIPNGNAHHAFSKELIAMI